MTNPYPANFETPEGTRRLTGQVNFTDPANQPGATFNGGTITNPLTETIAATAVGSTSALTVEQAIPAALAESVFTVAVSRDGAGNNEADLSMNGAGTGQALIGLSGDTTQGAVAIGSTDGYAANDPVTGATYFSATPAILRFLHNAAPADAALAASSCAFWLDDTNGASKLMVKAKSANGTVVTAAIALSP